MERSISPTTQPCPLMNRWIELMASRDQRSLGWYGRIATPELPTGLVRARQRARNPMPLAPLFFEPYGGLV